MYNNTTSLHPTHFLRGSELVDEATSMYNAASENWPYPAQFRYGMPMDNYYAEIWVNGMDWQNNYWALEEIQLEDPICQPLIIFEDSTDENKFNHHDFSSLVRAALYYRRDDVFVQHEDYGWYTDMVWPYLHLTDNEKKFEVTNKFVFTHASQKEVEFWMNTNFIPPYVMERGIYEKDRSSGNKTPELGGGVEKGGAEIIRIV